MIEAMILLGSVRTRRFWELVSPIWTSLKERKEAVLSLLRQMTAHI